MLPPGDLRNNIAALARDEDLMTDLLNYRFTRGELDGHSLGNLFLAALVEMHGSMDKAVQAAGRVLAIQGQVLPCTLEPIDLVADVQDPHTRQIRRIHGESEITAAHGIIKHLMLEPTTARALPAVTQAIWHADLVILGPGSLYTSVITNLLIHGVAEALRVSPALVVYVCNIATQPGETDEYTVADHVKAIEDHAGYNIIDVVIANNHYPLRNAGPNTVYVQPAPADSPIYRNYRVIYTDLTDDERPWRHSPEKLRKTLTHLELFSSSGRALGQMAGENVDEMTKGQNPPNAVQSIALEIEDTPMP
jgi:uncharacterized cofD-like protein